MSDTESNDAWLGLLKWSLNYVDGTVPSEESPAFKQMSAEDRAFLEDVMKNGIIDEGQRMKTILSSLVSYLDDRLGVSSEQDGDNDNIASTDHVSELLLELKDIVDQIDFAKSFAVMGGIDFLLGCSANGNKVPETVRIGCLAVLSTLSQNNPHVQFMMLERGSIIKLLQMYFATFQQLLTTTTNNNNNECDDERESTGVSLRAKIVQATSSSIRNHEMAEKIFCMNDDGIKMIESGLGMIENDNIAHSHQDLRKKSLFFLQALVTSDFADSNRISKFGKAIQFVTSFLNPENEDSQEIREMSLSMLNRILERGLYVNCILDLKHTIVNVGVRRVTYLRQADGEEKEYTQEELNLWESLLVNIARTPRDNKQQSNS